MHHINPVRYKNSGVRTGCHCRRYIKKRTPNPYQKYKRFRHFLFQQLLSKKRKSRLRECRLVRKKVHEQLVYMYQWFACHLRGFRNAQGISWPNTENCTAAPTPRTVGILEAELLKPDFCLQNALVKRHFCSGYLLLS